MADLRKRLMQNVIDTYPDDDSIKEVQLWAEGKSYTGGDRHVLIQWKTADIPPNSLATQVVQLTGQAGNYAYHANVVKARNASTLEVNTIIPLGNFTRAQRNKIQELASAVVFSKKSTTNGCRVWTRDLLEAMVGAGLITKQKFEEIDSAVPLVKRKPEA